MSHWITIVTPHGPMNGWSAEPDDRPVGGVVLIPEIFGVNFDMRQIAERYANEGYLVVVPALFDKIQREVELDYGVADHQLGNGLADHLGLEVATELARTAAGAIAHAGKTAIIGFGWGGSVGLRAAQELTIPAISYYVPWDLSWLSGPLDIPVQFHYGESDPRLSSLALSRIHEAIPNLEEFAYPAGEAFARLSDPSQFHAQSAQLAFDRTRYFLRTHIRNMDI